MDLTPLPVSATLQEHRRQADELLLALTAGGPDAVEFLRRYHPDLCGLSLAEIKAAQLTIANAQHALAYWHHLDNWLALEKWLNALHADHSPVLRFELAVEAVINGDIPALQSLLQQDPGLIHARSVRKHHAMLLHYTGTNGVEDYRQQCPSNALAVLQLLLAAGAEVNAIADMYGGGSTTLGLTATSVHPVNAGIMFQLLETLLAAGAIIDPPEMLARGIYIVNSCLHNGRPESAAFLARHGAWLDLEGAAGVGRLNLLSTFFNEDGSLKPGIAQAKLEAGFAWACEYGHDDVIGFLLEKKIDIDALVEGLPGLHWAIIGGHPDTVKLLIEHKASLEKRNSYDGTALEAALWALTNSWPISNTYDTQIICTLVAAGAQIDRGIIPWLSAQTNIPAPKKTGLMKILQ